RDGGLPGRTVVRRARNAPNVNVGEQHSPVRGRGDRTDPKRRSYAPAVDHGRTRIPCVSTRDDVEAGELFELSGRAHAQNARIVAPDVDDVANGQTAREIQFRCRDRAPDAVRPAPAERASVDNRESAATPIGRERSDRLTGELLAEG